MNSAVVKGIAALAVLLVVAAGTLWWRGHLAAATTVRPERVWAPLSKPVQVEVLNAGGAVGAARVGMLMLRRAKLDVVSIGNAPGALSGRDRNAVLVRRGDTTGAGRVIEALGDAEIVAAPDTTRLVDLTVLLGKRFRATSHQP